MDDEDFELDTNEEDETGTDDVSAEETAAEKYKPAYPVNFSAKNGDTTSQAFAKHINEIVRIYGLLAGIDASTIDAGAVNTLLQNHINSTNPHPNLNLSNTKGNLDAARLQDTIDGNTQTGVISAARVKGKLTNAMIDVDNVVNLSSKIPSVPTVPSMDTIAGDVGSGITDKNSDTNGYMKFRNGLAIQWGRASVGMPYGEEQVRTVNFSKQFTNCFVVMLTYVHLSGAADNDRNFIPHLLSKGANSFKYKLEQAQTSTWDTNMAIEYIAIGTI